MKTNRGFTAVELLATVAVIGVLAGLIVPPTVRALKFAQQKIQWLELSHGARMDAAMNEGSDTNALRVLASGIGNPSMWDIKTLGR